MFALLTHDVNLNLAGSGLDFPLLISPSSTENGVVRTHLFAYRIPYLPDFSIDPEFKRETRNEFISAFHERWCGVIRSLFPRKNVGLSLRYVYEPSTADIKIALVGFIIGTNNIENVKKTATEIASVLAPMEIPLEPITDPGALDDWIKPFEQPCIAEVRNKEDLLLLQSRFYGPVDAYIVRPTAGPKGDWLDVFRAMLKQKEKVVIATYLYPTSLFHEEQEYLQFAAGRMEQELRFSPQTRYGIQFDDCADPHCETGREIYMAALARLREPYVCVSQILSSSPNAAITIASLIKSAAQEDNVNSNPLLGKHPQGLDVCGYSELPLAARITYEQGWPMAWGATEASVQLRRWKYLMDAKSAASLFRLPIPLNSGLPGIDVRKPRVGMNPISNNSETASLRLATGQTGRSVVIPIQDITRHALVCGIPGSGKTNTCLHLLYQLWVEHKIPFWVIEPAKTEYRRLLTLPGFEDALVFTLGDEEVAPFRLNPFAVADNLSLERHLNDLEQAIVAGMPGLSRDERLLPMLLISAIREAYKANMWRVSDKGNCGKRFPVWGQLFEFTRAQCENYGGDVKKNLIAAIEKRVRVLAQGHKGRMLNTPSGFPWTNLLSRPVIFELQAMGESSKLMILFLLMRLRQEAAQRTGGALAHVVLLEEAHRVIGATPKGNEAGNEEGAIARLVEDMLAELRGFGEGLIIAEQSPCKLIPGALAMTSLKIVHRLASKEDVEAVGSSLAATDEQKATFQRLRVGEAALFADRMEGLSFVNIDNFKDHKGFAEFLKAVQLTNKMQSFYANHPDVRLPLLGCHWCKHKCAYRNIIDETFRDDFKAFQSSVPKRLQNTPARWIGDTTEAERKLLRDGLVLIEQKATGDAGGGVAWCLVAHTTDEDHWLTEQDYQTVLKLLDN